MEGRVWQKESLFGQWAQTWPYRCYSLTPLYSGTWPFSTGDYPL